MDSLTVGLVAICRVKFAGETCGAFAVSIQSNRFIDHSDAMNTEKTKSSLTDLDSLIGDLPALTPALVFLCVHRVSVVLTSVFTA